MLLKNINKQSSVSSCQNVVKIKQKLDEQKKKEEKRVKSRIFMLVNDARYLNRN